MTDRSVGLFERLKARGEEAFTQVSNQLMASPQFMKAMEGAMRGKAKLDQAVGLALKNMNIPTRTEFKKALRRIESLEAELADLRSPASSSRGRSGRRPRKTRTRRAATPPEA